MRFLHGIVVLSLTTASAKAQDHATHVLPGTPTASTDVAAFVAAARLGTERYRNRSVAIAAGFRRLGRDFPSMGEHWAHPGKVIAGRFDVADPAMLTYASIDGKPVLLGVVYAIPLEPGENPPVIPGGAIPWHEHNGTVDEESFLPEHGGEHSEAHSGTRLAILHVWTLLPNPAGAFAAENWSLPFARLHLAPPASALEATARALSLVSGSEEFYSNLLESELPSTPQEAWRAPLAAASARARAILARGAPGDTLSRGQIDALEEIWIAFLGTLSNRSSSLVRRLGGGAQRGR